MTFTTSGKLLASLSDPSMPDGKTVNAANPRHEIDRFDANGNVDWRKQDVDGSGGLIETPKKVIYAAPRWPGPDGYYAIARLKSPE